MADNPAPVVRRFARYRPTERDIDGRHFWAVPEGGLCLSVFVIVTPPGDPTRVLAGRPDPAAPWSTYATLEATHLAAIGDRWILPASHLLEFEGPLEAAGRVAREQLSAPGLAMDGPEVASEVYPSVLDPESGSHWDLHFLFRSAGAVSLTPPPAAWRELAWLQTRDLSRAAFARGHGDILALAGIRLRV